MRRGGWLKVGSEMVLAERPWCIEDGKERGEMLHEPIPASRCDVGVSLCQVESLSDEPPQPRQV